jgi:hypothetical protein
MPEPQGGQSGGVTNTGTMNTGGGNVVGGNMTVNTTTSTMSKIAIAFQPLANAVKEAPPALQPAAEATLASLKKEVEKSEQGEKPNDTVRECVPGPQTPFLEVNLTGHITSYETRTNHELATH